MLKILVVDDDPTTVALLETLLRGEGYMVKTAADGASALEKAKSFVPDILLTDFEMPGLTGNQLIASVRGLPWLKGVYSVVLTSHGAKADKMKALLSGADDFVVKPAQAAEIVGRLELARRVLRERAAAREAERQAGRPDPASVVALSAVLGRVRDLVAEAEAALSISDPASAGGKCREARAAVEQALRALREGGA